MQYLSSASAQQGSLPNGTWVGNKKYAVQIRRFFQMKKVFMLILCAMVFVGIASAQVYNSGTGISGGTHDILGAHNDGGRGCAGCHAPHSGGQGGGGNIGTNAAAFNDAHSGDDALFGQDLTPLYNTALGFGGGGDYEVNVAAWSAGSEEIRGILMCLACHDGNVAKGGMMTGKLYEQTVGLLPVGNGGEPLYGTRDIPTLLGADNPQQLGDYNNDHPVGPAANFGALRLGSYMTLNGATSGSITGVTVTSAAYNAFVANYGIPSIMGSKWSFGFALDSKATSQNQAFITCTTCHNQHVMYVYQAPAYPGYGNNHTVSGQNIIPGGNYPTYFFINAPYNPGAWGASGNASTKAPSTTQFCRQCHFGEANEAFGVNGVTTAY
jgi:hypothetical protein